MITDSSKFIRIDTDTLSPISPDGGMWENRLDSYFQYEADGVPKCSVVVCGYNRLAKTKYCVECIITNTSDIDYELILVDNGSSDGTLEYFQSVDYDKKRIIHITNNLGLFFATNYAIKYALGKYIIIIPNDVYVTQKWLLNLLCCYESDPTIGFVAALSSNVSNLQQYDLVFSNNADMQTNAAEFNQSNSSKWEERMRLISLISIYSRDVIDIVGVADPSFVHDFGEDDYAMRLRRNGYRLVLCKDTWVHHDHDFRNMEDKDPSEYQHSLESGRSIFREKWHGIDAWDDIVNFEQALLAPIDLHAFISADISSLCIDVRCGTPVLEIRNRLRKRGLINVDSYAFTTNAKFCADLNTNAVCGNDVVCDRIDFIQDYYPDNSFDIVALGEPINTYSKPLTLLQRLFNFVKPGGLLLLKLRNTNDLNAFMLNTGIGGTADEDMPVQIPLSDFIETIKMLNGEVGQIVNESISISVADKLTVMQWLKSVNSFANESNLNALLVKNYIFSIKKM